MNRQTFSESDLSKCGETAHDEQKNAEYSYVNEARLVRSLSDSLLTRTQVQSLKYADYEFIKISSNFNEAMEEVTRQKQKIKQEFIESKNKPVVNVAVAAQDLAADNEVKKVTENNPELTESQMNLDDIHVARSVETKNNYFPKSKFLTILTHQISFFLDQKLGSYRLI